MTERREIDRLRGEISAELVSANEALLLHVQVPDGCSCGFASGSQEEVARHLADAPRLRVLALRRLLRAHVASAVLDDLEGELLTKEVWESCEGSDELAAVRREIEIVAVDVMLGRYCCIPSSGGSCPGCGYPKAYAHPDCVDDAFEDDAVYVFGTAIEVMADPDLPRGIVRVVQGQHRGFEYVDHPLSLPPREGADRARETAL